MSNPQKVEFNTALLRTLHRIHRQLADLNSQLDRGPRQIKAGEAMVAAAAAAVEELAAKIKKATIASDEKQLQLRSRENRIEDLKSKLNTAASNREFSTLQEQIAADEQANSVLSDEIFEALENIDELSAKSVELKKDLAKQQEEHAARVTEIGTKMSSLQSDLARVNAELAESEKQIPSVAFAVYKRLVESKGDEALAPVESESCGGCYQTLTTQHIERMRMSVLTHCPNCNAFLYLPEDTTVK